MHMQRPVEGAPLVDSNFPLAQTSYVANNLGAEPGYKVPLSDPVYGTTITRLTNNTAGNPVERHRYSSSQTFNADGSVIYLEKGNVFV